MRVVVILSTKVCWICISPNLLSCLRYFVFCALPVPLHHLLLHLPNHKGTETAAQTIAIISVVVKVVIVGISAATQAELAEIIQARIAHRVMAVYLEER